MKTNLPRDKSGVRIDVRGERNLDFSKWHRTLHRKCLATDLDFLEYRYENGKLMLKALVEIKEWHVRSEKYFEDNPNFKAIKMLSNLSNIPFYVIWYKKESTSSSIIEVFELWDTNKPREKSTKLTPKQMSEFLEIL